MHGMRQQFKYFEYRPTQTKAFELVNGIYKKSHRGTFGPMFDVNDPKCTHCRGEVEIKKEGTAKSGSKFVMHYCPKCKIYYNTFFANNIKSDNSEDVDPEWEDNRQDFAGNPKDFGDHN